jgi:hypothetical protein
MNTTLDILYETQDFYVAAFGTVCFDIYSKSTEHNGFRIETLPFADGLPKAALVADRLQLETSGKIIVKSKPVVQQVVVVKHQGFFAKLFSKLIPSF